MASMARSSGEVQETRNVSNNIRGKGDFIVDYYLIESNIYFKEEY